MFRDIFKFLSSLSHFSTKHGAEHATLTKNNTTQSYDFKGLNAHVLVQLFLCTLNNYPINDSFS